jgi:hypothetical protein
MLRSAFSGHAGLVANDRPRHRMSDDSLGAATITTFALLSPVLDDWVSFLVLVGEISKEFTGSYVRFLFFVIDHGSVTPADLHRIILPCNTCISKKSRLFTLPSTSAINEPSR